jgi:hypothetical protein
MKLLGAPLRGESERTHHVELEPYEVGDVIIADALSAQVRVNQAHPPKALTATASTPEVGDKELIGVTHNDVLNETAPVDRHPDLTVEFTREFTEGEGERGRDDLVGADFTLIESAEAL